VGNASDDRANVLRFWRAVEIFSPRDIPAANPRQPVYDIASDGPLPWEHGHALRRVSLPDGKTWRHTVYGGIYPIERVRDVLQREFAGGAERFDTPPSGETALRAECARTFTRLVTGSDGAAPGPERDVEPEARPVGSDLLRELRDAVAERFGITADLRPAGIRVKSIQVSISRDPDADRGGELLNSLFAADLDRVGVAVGRGDCGAALAAYLRGPVETAERVDLRSRPGVVIPQEGARARWILHGLTSRYNVEPDRVFVLSPFRDVAHHIELMGRDFPGLRGGTVHTAQGKEADVVILILGGSPLKPGARDWASGRPNLLNVAVSRARQRLYVVGDLAAWEGCPNFRELAASLPVRLPAGHSVA
jgi:hypothetical protein